MGTTGTIMGTSRYLKETKPDIRIIGVQPTEGSSIPGIRRWPEAYLPSIFDPARVDETMDVSQELAEETTRLLASREGIFCGVSSGGATAAAIQLSETVEDAVIVSIICDRGDRYLSTGVFPA
jgi:cysteine synthase B